MQFISHINKRPTATSLTWETVPINKHINFAQSYDFTIKLNKRKKTLSHVCELNGLLHLKTKLSFNQRFFVLSLVAWNWPNSSEKKIFKFRQYIFAFLILPPFEKRQGPALEWTWIPILQGCFVPSLVEIGPKVLEMKHFKFHQCNFTISLLSPLGKRRGPYLFEWTWTPIIQGCIVPSLAEIGLIVLVRVEDFLKFHQMNVFSLFLHYLPLKKGGVLCLNELESPLSKDALCQVWLKLVQWLQRE